MVEKDVASEITEEDVEKIKEMQPTPMYISKKMLNQIRTTETEQETTVESGNQQKMVQKKKQTTEEKEQKDEEGNPESDKDNQMDEKEQEKTQSETKDDFDYGKKSSHFSNEQTVQIKDTRNQKKEFNTKVEILDDIEIKKEEKDVPEFLQNYNDRYEKMKKILQGRRELQAATTINRLERKNEGDEATTIGMVKDKYSTRNGKFIVEIEDNTGTFKVLADEREGSQIVQDEVIGVTGNLGGDIIYADKIVWPDLPIPQGTQTTKDEVKAAFISDLHLGSKDTLYKRLDRFAEWLNTKEAEKIGYLVIAGDLVEGVGTYPGQEEELQVTDIYKQYELFEDWFKKLPDHIEVIVGPGNHDIVRLAEPQPRLPEKSLENIMDHENLHLVQNPQMIRLHAIRSKGIKVLMYHGMSFDGHADQIKELREKGYDQPDLVMKDLLKRRHLAPTYGTNLLSPEETDRLVIENKPDVFVAGHFHSHANETYKGVNLICSSTFQSQTDFQKRMGHEPDPGKVTILDLKTRNTEVKQF